jgi:hypothetical protein
MSVIKFAVRNCREDTSLADGRLRRPRRHCQVQSRSSALAMFVSDSGRSHRDPEAYAGAARQFARKASLRDGGSWQQTELCCHGLASCYPRTRHQRGHLGHINLLPLACSVPRLPPRAAAARRSRVRSLASDGSLCHRWCEEGRFFLPVSEFTRRKFLGWTGLSEERGRVVPDCVELQDFSPGPNRLTCSNATVCRGAPSS